ncbi:MAG TPA: long-chain-fatty-acid--CoA ligase [Candidatus Kryptonia bacterium]|nr:long-chain-fatty-acid--CoA ligase [Candidatus Kryptonia bacterium]
MLLLGDILRRHAAVRGDKTAYVVGDDRVTYRAFHTRSNQLARALQRLGVRRGDRVAVMANNRVEYPLIYFAAVKLGAIVVPINARFTAAEVGNIVNHSEAETFFVASEFASLATELRAASGLPSVRRFISVDPVEAANEWSLGRLADAESGAEVGADIDENDTHAMLYTSGTTGSPKGTMLSQRCYYLQAGSSHLQLGFTEDDIGLSMFPMFHMGGWALPLGFWHTGATAVIMPKADPRAILAAIEREHATYLYAVPTVFKSLLVLPDFDRFDLRSLRLLGSGTAAMTAAEVRQFMDRFGCRDMVILYGSTEAGPVSVVRPRDVARKPETVGRPYLNVEVRLVDEAGHEVACGAVGEIAVRSEFIMQGYWRNPEETARTIRDGWVLTGDLGVFDDEGFLSIVGRRKEIIRSGGESIFPVEIERVLLTHPAIREASVIGIPDPHWGEAVVAAIVLREGAALADGEVTEYVRTHLASYKKPRHVCFFDHLPRTAASQQVNKAQLRELVLEELTGKGSERVQQTNTRPGTQT